MTTKKKSCADNINLFKVLGTRAGSEEMCRGL